MRWPAHQRQLASFANGDVLDAEWHARFGDSPTNHRGGAALVWCEANLVAIAQIIGQKILGCPIWHTPVLDQHDVRIDVDAAIRDVAIRAYRMWRSHADTYLNLGLRDEAEWSRLVDIIDGRADLLLVYQEVLGMDEVDDVAIALEFALDPSEPVDRAALKTELDQEFGHIMSQIAAAVGDNALPLAQG